jgi:hypothetical protein
MLIEKATAAVSRRTVRYTLFEHFTLLASVFRQVLHDRYFKSSTLSGKILAIISRLAIHSYGHGF